MCEWKSVQIIYKQKKKKDRKRKIEEKCTIKQVKKSVNKCGGFQGTK